MTRQRQEQTQPSAPLLMCATAGCPYEARVKIRQRRSEWKEGLPNPIHVPYGPWLNLCHACNDVKIRRENLEHSKLMGLDTPAKQKAWCQQQLKRGILKHEPSREPGSDDE